MSEVHAGGCQCGAVRYEIHSNLQGAHVCHCRMCQRATGGLFAALVGSRKANIVWTKGAPTFFESSNIAARGFCNACGTPLTFAYNDPKARFYVTIGSLDDPATAPIERQFGVENRISWVRLCEDVPGETTGEHDPAFFQTMVSKQS